MWLHVAVTAIAVGSKSSIYLAAAIQKLYIHVVLLLTDP
jgi:hypothetical protein